MIKRSDILFVVSSFLGWRIFILLIAFFSIKYLPLFSNNYLGGGYSNYILKPLFWGHLNFDGEHYLAIAQNGYRPLEYFFFPLFTLIIKNLNLGKNLLSLATTGILVSNISFVVALMGFYKLIRLDFSERVARFTVILLLLFPTSFYFGMYYTESLFLCLVVWSMYFARRDNYLLASIMASFASATRIVGIVLLPVLLVECLLKNKKSILNILEVLFISPIGLLVYMYYLLQHTGDPLIFFHEVSIFGEQRSSTLISLPQVFYRYVFKIIPNVSYVYFPNVFTTYLEFSFALLFLAMIIFCVIKLRLSYSFFAATAFIIPTLAGSFSSMPRYALVIFPVFILAGVYFSKLPLFIRFSIFFVMIVLFIIAESLFWRGYWVS